MPAFHRVLHQPLGAGVELEEVIVNSRGDLAVAKVSICPNTGGPRRIICVPFRFLPKSGAAVVCQKWYTKQITNFKKVSGAKRIGLEVYLKDLRVRVRQSFYLLSTPNPPDGEVTDKILERIGWR